MDDEATDLGGVGFGLKFYNARWYDPYLNHFTQPDSIVPDPYNPQDWNRYSYVRNNPVRYIDPSGHMIDDGCKTDGCSLTQYQKEQNAQKLAILEKESQQRKCNSGNYNYCSTVELIAKRHPKPVSGIHVGYSGQAGPGLEGGVYHQWDALVDWKEGNLYVVKTVGTFVYLGSPTGIEGDVYVGTSNVHGIPSDVKDISGFLKGPQFDASASVNADVGLFAGGGKGVNVDLDENGKPIYTSGAGYMYTT